MTGPRDSNINVHFSLDLESARAPPHVQAATRLHFRLKQNRRNEASVSLVRSLAGPQEIELQLRMDVVSDHSYGGAAVAKILLYVSQFDY
jgi:fibulin 1/2